MSDRADQLLRDLVACKDLKERADAISPVALGFEKDELMSEYRKRQPKAWAAARAYLSENQPIAIGQGNERGTKQELTVADTKEATPATPPRAIAAQRDAKTPSARVTSNLPPEQMTARASPPQPMPPDDYPFVLCEQPLECYRHDRCLNASPPEATEAAAKKCNAEAVTDDALDQLVARLRECSQTTIRNGQSYTIELDVWARLASSAANVITELRQRVEERDRRIAELEARVTEAEDLAFERGSKQRAAQSRIAEALEYCEDREDIVDGEFGPLPNDFMHIATILKGRQA